MTTKELFLLGVVGGVLTLLLGVNLARAAGFRSNTLAA
jgi:hypothetical protein